MTFLSTAASIVKRASLLLLLALCASPIFAQGEADLRLPDLSTRHRVFGHRKAHSGADDRPRAVSVLGLVFGLMMYQVILRDLPVHSSMLEISELIYETCKTYMIDAGQVPDHAGSSSSASIIVSLLRHSAEVWAVEVAIILAFSIIGIAGSYWWPGSAFA